MKKFLWLVIVLMGMTYSVQASDSMNSIKPIHNMFDAMREHDGKKLLAQFAPSAMLQRAGKGNEVETSDLIKFADFVSKTKKHLDEQLLSVNISISDNLASVWTPYVFYLDGKVSHCGVNSFQLVKFEQSWKIVYLIDNTHAGNCQVFIKKHS